MAHLGRSYSLMILSFGLIFLQDLGFIDCSFCFGGLAQLVERLLCKQDVSGSSPLTSTEEYVLFLIS
jgi:hypothetical protein